ELLAVADVHVRPVLADPPVRAGGERPGGADLIEPAAVLGVGVAVSVGSVGCIDVGAAGHAGDGLEYVLVPEMPPGHRGVAALEARDRRVDLGFRRGGVLQRIVRELRRELYLEQRIAGAECAERQAEEQRPRAALTPLSRWGLYGNHIDDRFSEGVWDGGAHGHWPARLEPR